MALSLCFTPAHQHYVFVPEKSLFVTATQEALPDPWPAELMFAVSQNCIYLQHAIKSCCLRICLPNSMDLGANTIPLGILTSFGTPSTVATSGY